MHVLCQRDRLWSAFQVAASVVPARSPKAILQHVRFEVTGPSATLSATDLEIGVELEVEGIQCSVPGVVILPADRFGSIVRETSEEMVELKADGNNIEVLVGKSRFELPVHSPEEYPQKSHFDFEHGYHSLRASSLRELIRRTLFATSPDSNRYDLGGILLEMRDGRLIAVSTDGRRLAKMESLCETVGHPESPGTMTIVPSRAMNLLQRTVGDDAEVQFLIHENEIVVRSAGMTFYSRLLEGRFPRWEMVIPRDREGHGIEMTVGPLLSALRQSAIVADPDSRGINFDFQAGMLILSSSTAERGNCRVPLPISYDGPSIDVRLDYRFFEEFLKVLELDAVFLLSVKDEESAALCSVSDGYEYVLMPLARLAPSESKMAGTGAAS